MAQSPDDESDDAKLRARLDKLSTSLGARDTLQTKPEPVRADPGMSNAMGAGFRVVSELVAGVLVGGGLGWLLDKLLHTKPLMMILLGSLGLAGGFWNVIRSTMPRSGPRSGPPSGGKNRRE